MLTIEQFLIIYIAMIAPISIIKPSGTGSINSAINKKIKQFFIGVAKIFSVPAALLTVYVEFKKVFIKDYRYINLTYELISIGSLLMTLSLLILAWWVINSKKISKNIQSNLLRNKELFHTTKTSPITISLYQLHSSSNLPHSKNEVISILDTPIQSEKEDIANFSYTSKSLLRAIKSHPYETGLIISLQQKWGYGKTSVINLLKENILSDQDKFNTLDTPVVFEPLKYSENNEILEALYLTIVKCFNIPIDPLRSLIPIDILSGPLQHKTGLDLKNISSTNLDKKISRLKKYTSKSQKTRIIIIDDIDRLSKEQTISVFKAVQSIFRLPNLAFILCYERERIERIFSEDLDKDRNFVDKIIDFEINIPNIAHRTLRQIFITCLNNLLLSYDYPQYIKMVNYYDIEILDFDSFRDIIRFLNFISPNLRDIKDTQYSMKDFLIIRFIEMKYPNSYIDIYRRIDLISNQSQDYFMYSDDKKESIRQHTIKNIKDLPDQFKDWLIDVFKKPNNISSLDEIDGSISSRGYTYWYFNQSYDHVPRINKDVRNFIENKLPTLSINDLIKVEISSYQDIREIALQIKNYIKKTTLDQQLLHKLFSVILSHSYGAPDRRGFLKSSDLESYSDILSGIIKLPNADKSSLASQISVEPNPEVANRVVQWLSSPTNPLQNENKEAIEIIKENIQIYLREKYFEAHNNLFKPSEENKTNFLIAYAHTPEELSTYASSRINAKNLPTILYYSSHPSIGIDDEIKGYYIIKNILIDLKIFNRALELIKKSKKIYRNDNNILNIISLLENGASRDERLVVEPITISIPNIKE